MTQAVGMRVDHGPVDRVCARCATDFLDIDDASPKGTMYISVGALIVILLLFLLFRAMSGRRV
jgi:hypothetical protein